MLSRLDLVAWVLAVAAGAVLLLSGRAPPPGLFLGLGVSGHGHRLLGRCSHPRAVLVVTGADPVVSVVAGVAGLWLFFAARVRVRVLQHRREELVARAHERVRDVRARS